LSLALFLVFGIVAVLLLGLVWALWESRERKKLRRDLGALDECGQRHVDYLPQIRQALAPMDFDFLLKSASRDLQRRVRRERLRVALGYLAAVRGDFQSLLRTAKVIAVMSPEVAAVDELERLRLTAKFTWQYQMIRWKLLAGLAPVPQLDGLSNLVSDLSVRIEVAMKELGERAAAAAKLASTVNRRGLDAV
jgi:hypothetical protein